MRSTYLLSAGLLAACCGSAVAQDAGHGTCFKLIAGLLSLDGGRELGGTASTMSVIGAGFSRTGTKSLEAALIRLGHKVYDTRSMLQLGHVARWEEAAVQYKASGNMTEFDSLLAEMEARGYTATLDFPMNLYAPLFAERRPLAQVVMSIRPSEDSWVEAWGTVNHILSIFTMRPWKWVIDMKFTKRIVKTLYDFQWDWGTYPEHISRPLPWFEIAHDLPAFATDAKKAEWKALHRTLQTELEQKLSKERFTTFDVRSGWAPLLKFLKINDPQLAAEPFPNVNDRGGMQMVRYVMDVVAAGLPIWLTFAVLVQLWALRKLVTCMSCRALGSAKEKSV